MWVHVSFIEVELVYATLLYLMVFIGPLGKHTFLKFYTIVYLVTSFLPNKSFDLTSFFLFNTINCFTQSPLNSSIKNFSLVFHLERYLFIKNTCFLCLVYNHSLKLSRLWQFYFKSHISFSILSLFDLSVL